MTIETVDLYKYFKIQRKEEKRGYLTRMSHPQLTELGVTKERPHMLVIPGGGYAMVSQREAEPVAMSFYAAGFDVSVLDYEVAPVSYPAQIMQAGMAMLYLRREAKKLYIDAEHIAAVGFSAGGHLLGCISLLWDDPALVSEFGEECEKIRPDASIYSYAVISSEKGVSHEASFRNFCGSAVKFENYSLEKRVRSSASPSFIWATTTDDAVPVENSLLLYSALRKAGVKAEMHIFEEGWHGLSVCDGEVYPEEPKEPFVKHCKNWIELAEDFLQIHGFKVKTL